MSLFLGTRLNRIDTKGRVSIPASFRSCLKEQKENNSFIFRPSHKLACIEVWPLSIFTQLTLSLDDLDPLSDDHEDLATILYAEAWSLELDKEGRVSLPEPLKIHANLTEHATFLGLGKLFQIWHPKEAEIRCQKAREKIKHRSIPLSPLALRRLKP